MAGGPASRRAPEPFLPWPLGALIVTLVLAKGLSYGALLPDGAARLLPAALAVAGLCALRANPFRVHPTLPA